MPEKNKENLFQIETMEWGIIWSTFNTDSLILSRTFNATLQTHAKNSPSSLPLWVTRSCRRPSFVNMSTTVSMGVWSVIVIGARSRIRRKRRLGPLQEGLYGSRALRGYRWMNRWWNCLQFPRASPMILAREKKGGEGREIAPPPLQESNMSWNAQWTRYYLAVATTRYYLAVATLTFRRWRDSGDDFGEEHWGVIGIRIDDVTTGIVNGSSQIFTSHETNQILRFLGNHD